MAKRRKGRRWCRVLVGSQWYDVVFVDPKDCLELGGGLEAVTLFDKTLIAIRKGMSPERNEDCLGHEICGHALLDGTGLDHMLREKLGLTASQWEKFEEVLARCFVPALFGVLKANKWARLPRQPRQSAAPSRSMAAKKRRSK